MHIPTHILSGWCLANALPLTSRERLFCMLAASLPDIDGLGIIFGQEAYWRFHHIAGHNVFFGLSLSATLAGFARSRWLTFAACFTLFHAHLLMDFYGSGPGWAIHYLWPVEPYGWKTDAAWELSSWQNRVAFGVLLVVTVFIARRQHRTPLELLAPRLDQAMVRRPMSSVDGHPDGA